MLQVVVSAVVMRKRGASGLGRALRVVMSLFCEAALCRAAFLRRASEGCVYVGLHVLCAPTAVGGSGDDARQHG